MHENLADLTNCTQVQSYAKFPLQNLSANSVLMALQQLNTHKKINNRSVTHATLKVFTKCMVIKLKFSFDFSSQKFHHSGEHSAFTFLLCHTANSDC